MALPVYYTFLPCTLNNKVVQAVNNCCFACSESVVVVVDVGVVVVYNVVAVATTVGVADVVVAVTAQLTADKNKLDANYEVGDIGDGYQDVHDAFDDGKNPQSVLPSGEQPVCCPQYLLGLNPQPQLDSNLRLVEVEPVKAEGKPPRHHGFSATAVAIAVVDDFSACIGVVGVAAVGPVGPVAAVAVAGGVDA